jgi:hypothetical protein
MACFIDPDGLFNGDRMAKLSLMARLYWPYFFAAANGYGRLEINYLRLTAKIFSRFPSVPTEPEVMGWIKEYADYYLLFLYRANGVLWGQFDTPEKYLPKYKDRASAASPSPGQAFPEWMRQYAKLKQAETQANPIACSVFENAPEVFPKNFQNISEEFPRAIAVAVAEENTSSSPTGSPDDAIEHTAQRIYARHPPVRRCGLMEVRKRLKSIVMKLPPESRIAKLESIDHNHAGWCATEAWTKSGGEFAKGLDNWLAPTLERFELPPPGDESDDTDSPKLLLM